MSKTFIEKPLFYEMSLILKHYWLPNRKLKRKDEEEREKVSLLRPEIKSFNFYMMKSFGRSLSEMFFEKGISKFLEYFKWSKKKKIKTSVLFMWLASWDTVISSFYCSDINLFLIDYAWCELSIIWFLLFENNSRSIFTRELNTGGKT